MPLETVMRALSETKAEDVLAIVDSCFSGAGGHGGPGALPRLAASVESRWTARRRPRAHVLMHVRCPPSPHPRLGQLASRVVHSRLDNSLEPGPWRDPAGSRSAQRLRRHVP